MARASSAARASRADETGPSAQPHRTAALRLPSRRWLALAVLCLPLLIVSLDNTVLNVVLPTLVRKLGASDSELQWIVDAYVLVFGGLLLAAGSLADRIGRKRTFLAGLLAFAAGSTWAAFSGTVAVLIAARASMGIGAALIMPSTLAIITDLFGNEDERQRAFGFWAGTTGAGVALGPIVGGLLLAHFWWGSVFLINVPVALLGFAVAIPLLPDSRDLGAPRPDLVGVLLSVGGIGLLLWAVIEAPVSGWSSAPVLCGGLGGAAVLVAFLAFEHHISHPMLNLELFKRRRFSIAITSDGLLAFGLYGALFVITQLLQFQLGYTPLQAGIRVLPAAGAIALVAPLSTLLLRKIGPKLTVSAGSLVVAAGLWQISQATAGSTFLDVLPGMVMLGLGAGLVIPSATGAVMGSLPAAHTGIGSATNSSFMQVGGALGVAVIGSLLSTRYEHRLTAALASRHLPHAISEALIRSLGGALEVARQVGGAAGRMLATAAREAFMSGLGLGMVAAACVAAAGAALALALLPQRGPAAADRDEGLGD